ncbi:MAG: hypothetical protein HOE48_03630, partial [Candidatus Latescibacteria bacterium]|nr:hypothetical protein [Candidatus Latescibacterota bacterium]
MVKNPTKKENCKAYGDLNILRLQPVDQQITVDYKCGGQASGEVVARVYDLNNQIVTTVGQPAVSGSFTLSDLLNRQDYLIDLIQYNEAGEEVAKSPMRLFRTGYVPGTVVNYIHPEDYTFM